MSLARFLVIFDGGVARAAGVDWRLRSKDVINDLFLDEFGLALRVDRYRDREGSGVTGRVGDRVGQREGAGLEDAVGTRKPS